MPTVTVKKQKYIRLKRTSNIIINIINKITFLTIRSKHGNKGALTLHDTEACALPQEAGNCTEKRPAWAFSSTENRCVPFYYTGCGGNDNRFDSERACGEACPAAHGESAGGDALQANPERVSSEYFLRKILFAQNHLISNSEKFNTIIRYLNFF